MDSAELLRLVRPAVRRAHAYRVGGTIDASVKLNQNESPYDLPDDLKKAAADLLFGVAANRYPTEQPDGLAARIADRIGHVPEGILVGNGSNELTFTLGLAFIEHGAPVVLPRPMFALYETMVRLHGGAVVPVAPLPSMDFDVEAILAAQHRTKARLTVVTTPNNPTGKAVSRADLIRIIDKAPGVILVDEAYVEFNPHGSVVDLIDRYPNLLVMRTLSKAFGLAGIRLGYLAGSPLLIGELLKARLPFMVDRITEGLATAVLDRPELISERVAAMMEGTAFLTTALAAMESVEVIPSNTNFVLFRTPLDAAELMQRLLSSGVLIRNMGGYPELKGFLRVSSGTPDENRVFLAALETALSTPG